MLHCSIVWLIFIDAVIITISRPKLTKGFSVERRRRIIITTLIVDVF